MDYILGEERYVRAVIVGDGRTPFTISSQFMTITLGKTVIVARAVAINVESGSAVEHELRFLFKPAKVGTYVATFEYVVGAETYYHRQALFVTP